ncbi:inorganic phosphate transporter [Rhizobium paknamense]|uniref:Phosphate transporter n=1 Tax=Rhizobium paknamense TaxID=1206817 RepID=A0ABU0I9N8_9HYPH|nr:inorganic phosphate transporter [Rhizobium paknamense]MDQ0454948.1 PiT family inorganic phosphate transporter [Rhizobium paknamense]
MTDFKPETGKPVAAKPGKTVLDKDLDRLTFLETATQHVTRGLAPFGLALIFVVLAAAYALSFAIGHPDAALLIAAAALAAYMAMNIGANDVTNNVGAAVGARAISMRGALLMAACFEIAGAMIGSREVVRTISTSIVSPALVEDPLVFAWIMMSALFAAALWINLATWLNAPVSTTHSMVGSIIGAGFSAVGSSAINWPAIAGITLGWVFSPMLGGLIAAGFLFVIYDLIVYRPDKIAAARRWLPILIGLMAASFSLYLTIRGVDQVYSVGRLRAFGVACIIGLAVWALMVPVIRRQSVGLENRNQSLRSLFRLPLVGSAALLSFAHGANDVSNAIGPLTGIVNALRSYGPIGFGPSAGITIPFWVMAIGSLGISVGLLLFGPRLIRLVGSKITKLNPMRAFCVAMSAAVTVITASWIGLPVSSTHIAVGAVFGVGFFREYYNRHSRRRKAYLAEKALSLRGAETPDTDTDETDEAPPRPARKKANRDEAVRRRLVRRSYLLSILLAWAVTLPVSAGLAAIVYRVMFALFG